MQINSVSSSSPVSFVKPTSSPKGAEPAGDQVSMSASADMFTSLVNDATNMPDVRSEVVDAYKARVQSGAYPSQDTLDGLVNLMGPTWAANAQSTGESSS